VQAFLIENDSFGNNIITGDKDGYSPISILEVYEVVNSTAPTGLTGYCKEGYYCTGSSKTPTQFASPSGSFSFVGSSNYTFCPKGTYNPLVA
jgi:hypothetical protein